MTARRYRTGADRQRHGSCVARRGLATLEPMLRVCHLASGDLWAGAEAQILTLLSHLRHVQDLEIEAVVLNDGRLADELRAAGVRTTVINEARANALEILRRLIRHFKARRPTIVHTHGYKQHILGALAAQVAGVPHTIQTIHGLAEPLPRLKRWRRAISRYLELLVMRLADRVIVVSRDLHCSVATKMPSRDVVATIHNGVDPERVRPCLEAAAVRARLGIGADAVVIGTVARLVPVKGIEYLIQAARIINDESLPVPLTYLIVGDGHARADLEKSVALFQLTAPVIFTGYRQDVYDLINAMDVFVLPSLHEGLPTVLLEVMLLEKPIVATAVGGIPELIIEGETGLLAPARNSQALAEKIIQAIERRDEAKRIAINAHSRAVDRFTTTHQAEKTHSLYKQLLAVATP